MAAQLLAAWMEGDEKMEIVIKGEAKEIAALVLAVQGRQDVADASEQDIIALAQATYDRQRELQGKPDS